MLLKARTKGTNTLMRGDITRAEIESQPTLWAAALRKIEQQSDAIARWWTAAGFNEVIFTGCGSTYYAGMMGAALLQAGTGITVRAVSATEVMLFPEMVVAAQRTTLLICVSRSGTTRETVAAADGFRKHGGHGVLVITCDSESPLAQTADLLLALDAAQEQSRVQTRSFSSMAVVITALAALVSGRDRQQLSMLPEALERLSWTSAATIDRVGRDQSITQFAFLGSGALYAIACEAMLKMTEMARVFSVSYHTLEYLHGPRYAADAHTLVVGLISESAYDEDMRALVSLRQRGLRVLAVMEHDQQAPDDLNDVIVVASGIPEWGRAILFLPPLQQLGWLQATERGFDPDNLPYDPRQTEG